MKINTIIVAILATVISMSLTACTDEANKNSTISNINIDLNDTNEIDNNSTISNININVNCTDTSTASDIVNYVTTVAGDSIVQDETNSTIALFIDAKNTKKICLVNGKAHIVRDTSLK